MEQRPQFPAGQVKLDTPQVYHIPSWNNISDRKRLALLREVIEQYGRDPRVVDQAINICKFAGVEPRDYVGQAKCLLKWVQERIYYVNEPGERLQSPLYTLKVGYGDCDDMMIVLCSFFEAVRLPWKIVISGKQGDKFVRYCEGDRHYPRASYSHVYCMVGNRPFTPTEWFYCEPTLKAPFGWDVVQAAKGEGPPLHTLLPELGGLGETSSLFSPSKTVARSIWKAKSFQIMEAAVIAAITAVVAELLLDRIRSSQFHDDFIKKGKRNVK